LVTSLSRRERAEVERLLAQSGLVFEGEPDCTVLVEDESENLAATASIKDNIIKMVAADNSYRDAGLAGTAISGVMSYARERGIYHLFIYTKPDMAEKFGYLGFSELAANDSAVLMESGQPSSSDFESYLKSEKLDGGLAPFGAAVMNCNPFTLGHRFLIESAASRCGGLYVIVVREDLSEFPFEDRMALVKAGTADIPNVRVINGGSYAVSRQTFPTYFLKDRADREIARIQAALDIDLFSRLFVPALSISERFVGSEPFSEVTRLYNEAMLKILPPRGVKVTVIPRCSDSAGVEISASRVREAIVDGDSALLEEALPAHTLEYLRSEKGAEVARRLRERRRSDG
jgi:[citrate (pro-3S)-lyase] ligase